MAREKNIKTKLFVCSFALHFALAVNFYLAGRLKRHKTRILYDSDNDDDAIQFS